MAQDRAALRKPLTGGQYAVIGSLSGMFEVLCQQPLVYFKNCIQQNQPISFRPSVLYRGVGIMCGSIAPVSAVQFAVDGVLATYVETRTDATRIGTAAFAGVCSSLLSSPAELVMTLQQHTGHAMVCTTQDIWRTHGLPGLYRGLPLTMLRETVWCACFLALGPAFGEKLHRHLPATFGTAQDATVSQRTAAALTGSVGAGLVAVLATQPVDTIKTILQGKAMSTVVRSSVGAEARQLWAQGGLRALYKGTVPRGLRLIGAVFILSETKRFLEDQVYQLNDDDATA
ncbi:Aste57867_2384 [Aphanomyces stellatus]|uniref:Aste57867_2384 protein n=1 Tax=Aphanomyces stellatus TaxID=120398 RepID=A0A485K7I9_9STRA|nr:hypothetical protein As57867_002378 [Aphanomyces stellatus]VFT79585.1 Aste57867_2384 [Aphanomyces stellatus]